MFDDAGFMRFESISTSTSLTHTQICLSGCSEYVMIALTALPNNKYIALHLCIIFTFGYLFHQAHPNWICNCISSVNQSKLNERACMSFWVWISSASFFFPTNSMLHFISSSTCECDEFSSFLFFVHFFFRKKKKNEEKWIKENNDHICHWQRDLSIAQCSIWMIRFTILMYAMPDVEWILI